MYVPRSRVLMHALDDPKLPPIPSRLAIVKLFLELALYTSALLVLQGIMAADDQEVEAWYLEGWCFFLMAEQAQGNGGKLDEFTWEDLARDARDCLETSQMVCTLVRASHKLTSTDYLASCTRVSNTQTLRY